MIRLTRVKSRTINFIVRAFMTRRDFFPRKCIVFYILYPFSARTVYVTELNFRTYMNVTRSVTRIRDTTTEISIVHSINVLNKFPIIFAAAILII